MASLLPASSLVASFYSMILAMVEVWTPWKLANTINQGLFACFLGSWLLNIYQHTASMELRLQGGLVFN